MIEHLQQDSIGRSGFFIDQAGSSLGADIHRRAGNGMNAVHSAAMKGWTATIRLLAERGAEVDIKDRDGKTPLDYASGNYKPTPQGGGLVVPPTVNPETVKLLQQLTKVH